MKDAFQGGAARTLTFAGFIKWREDVWRNFDSVVLVQPDGYVLDLVARLNEAVMNYGKRVSVRYWLAPVPVTRDEAVVGFLATLYGGDLNADYETNPYSYSEYTSGTDYDTVLDIGQHSLLHELHGNEGRYLVLEVEWPAPKAASSTVTPTKSTGRDADP